MTIDFFLIEQLRTANEMPILPCKRRVRFWLLSPEDYKEPGDAFKKVSWDKVRGSATSVKSRGVLNHLQSFLFLFCAEFLFYARNEEA